MKLIAHPLEVPVPHLYSVLHMLRSASRGLPDMDAVVVPIVIWNKCGIPLELSFLKESVETKYLNPRDISLYLQLLDSLENSNLYFWRQIPWLFL